MGDKVRTVFAMGLAAWLACLSPAQARSASDIGVFDVPPPVAQPHLPEGASAQPIAFSKIVIHLNDGEPWAEVRYELFSSPLDPLIWNGGKADLQPDAFAKIFVEELKKAGFAVDGDPSSLFETESTGDLKAGVLIKDMRGRFCYTCGLRIARANSVKGAVLMVAEWQIYSALERKVVATIPITAGYETDKGAPDAELLILMSAFRENVRALLADPRFAALVTAAPGSVSHAAAMLEPIAFKPVKQAAARPISEVSDSVVTIYAGDGSGSGFLVSNDGLVITNHHVVGGSKFVKVKWSDGSESLGEVLRSHKARDVALVKVDAHGRPPIGLRLAAVQAGETVFAIGTPLDDDFQNTLTKGIVSANRMFDGKTYIQSDVAVDHGNSGGPLVDEKGQVVGITQWGYAPDGVSHNLNFFIPIGDALDFLALKPQS